MSASTVFAGENHGLTYKNRYYRIAKQDDGTYIILVYEYNPETDKSSFVPFSRPYRNYENAAKYLDYLMEW